jgi:hypothetical protein
MSSSPDDMDLEAFRRMKRRAVEAAQSVLAQGLPKLTVRDEANALVANCLRNNAFFEELHAGTWSPLLEDRSLSRISDAEMKKLMIEVTARLAYMLALKSEKPEEYLRQIAFNLRDYAGNWERKTVTCELPAENTATIAVCSCGAPRYSPKWKYCPQCGNQLERRL